MPLSWCGSCSSRCVSDVRTRSGRGRVASGLAVGPEGKPQHFNKHWCRVSRTGQQTHRRRMANIVHDEDVRTASTVVVGRAVARQDGHTRVAIEFSRTDVVVGRTPCKSHSHCAAAMLLIKDLMVAQTPGVGDAVHRQQHGPQVLDRFCRQQTGSGVGRPKNPAVAGGNGRSHCACWCRVVFVVVPSAIRTRTARTSFCDGEPGSVVHGPVSPALVRKRSVQ